MANGPKRAQFWRDFILQRSGFPNPAMQRQQFGLANFGSFCEGGCNSFELFALPGAARLARQIELDTAVSTADFQLDDGRQLEIIMFANKDGQLSGVDVMCNANSEPVPDLIEMSIEPFATWASDRLVG